MSEETRKEEERLHLKQLSEERAAKWPNTLQVRLLNSCTSMQELHGLVFTCIMCFAGCKGSERTGKAGKAGSRGGRARGGVLGLIVGCHLLQKLSTHS